MSRKHDCKDSTGLKAVALVLLNSKAVCKVCFNMSYHDCDEKYCGSVCKWSKMFSVSTKLICLGCYEKDLKPCWMCGERGILKWKLM